MTITRRGLIAAAAGAVVVTSCASSGIRQGAYKAGNAFTVQLTRGWSDLTWMLTPRPPNVRMLSIDGPLLNRLYLAYLQPGQSMFRPRDRDTPRPTFRADMSDTETVEFIIDCIAVEYQSPTSSRLRPQNFGTSPGVRFDITTRTDEGLNISGTALAARANDRLNLILYLAPTEHYYATLLADVESAMGSAALT